MCKTSSYTAEKYATFEKFGTFPIWVQLEIKVGEDGVECSDSSSKSDK